MFLAERERTKLNAFHLRWFKPIEGVFALSVALFLMIGSHVKLPIILSMQCFLLDGTTSMIRMTTYPAHSLYTIWQNSTSYVQLHEKYKQLLARLDSIEHWEHIARRLNAENQILYEQLNMVPQPPIEFITTRAHRYHGHTPYKTLLVEAGSKHGVHKNQTVLANNQIIGRVIEVGTESARILLLTDPSSRIPVQTELSNFQAILAGSPDSTLNLTFLNGEGTLEVGEIVFTSGQGGFFPRGYKVGIIHSLTPEKITVMTDIDWEHIDFVQIVTSLHNTEKPKNSSAAHAPSKESPL